MCREPIILALMIATQKMEMRLMMIFLVAIKRMRKANATAIRSPCIAPVTKAYSEGIHMKTLDENIISGNLSFYESTNA